MLILMTTFTVYAYVLPYKETYVNMIELFFQLNLLIFLLLRSTRNIIDTYLKFPNFSNVGNDLDTNECSGENDIAYLTWILFPFAYLPLVVIMGIFIVKMLLKLR